MLDIIELAELLLELMELREDIDDELIDDMLLVELLDEDIDETELIELLLELMELTEDIDDELMLDAEDREEGMEERDIELLLELFHQPPLLFPLLPKTAARTHLRNA